MFYKQKEAKFLKLKQQNGFTNRINWIKKDSTFNSNIKIKTTYPAIVNRKLSSSP